MKKETQNRREFFKEAARKTLPILGAVVFMNNPLIAKVTEKEVLDCNEGCVMQCTSCTGCTSECGGCTGCTGCSNWCRDTCYNGCSGECTGGCKDSCKNNGFWG